LAETGVEIGDLLTQVGEFGLEVAEDGEDPAALSHALAGLVRMKLMSNRDQDRVHLRDLIDVGLVGRELLPPLPPELASRLDALLSEAGR